jgi:hypothetical protein
MKLATLAPNDEESAYRHIVPHKHAQDNTQTQKTNDAGLTTWEEPKNSSTQEASIRRKRHEFVWHFESIKTHGKDDDEARRKK